MMSWNFSVIQLNSSEDVEAQFQSVRHEGRQAGWFYVPAQLCTTVFTVLIITASWNFSISSWSWAAIKLVIHYRLAGWRGDLKFQNWMSGWGSSGCHIFWGDVAVGAAVRCWQPRGVPASPGQPRLCIKYFMQLGQDHHREEWGELVLLLPVLEEEEVEVVSFITSTPPHIHHSPGWHCPACLTNSRGKWEKSRE